MSKVLHMRRVVAKNVIRQSKLGAETLNQEAIIGVKQWAWKEESLQEMLDQPGDFIEFSYQMRSADFGGRLDDPNRHLALLRRVLEMTRVTLDTCPAGYQDVADFLREEAAKGC